VRVAALALAALLGACAELPTAPVADRVVLLPGSDGAPGAVIVEQGAQRATLEREYAIARASPAGALEVVQSDRASVESEFGEVINALPPAPTAFVVYFVFGQDELTEESRKAFGPMLQDFAGRPAPEITVIGHADQAGPERINDTLSLRRAERVKEMLVQRGVGAERIVAVGRGSREPAVRAPEGVAEPLNRRVEISVR
jgi:outer membrane protein OmpA-like peptidoglycan-associated protein